MDSDDMFDDVGSTLIRQPSTDSLGSTPIEFSGVVGGVVEDPEPDFSSSGPHQCPQCPSKLKTKATYTQHMMLHKLNDYNLRKPVEEELRAKLPDYFSKVLIDIGNEPDLGILSAQKKQLIQNISSSDTFQFLEEISKPLFVILLVKKKVLPSAQYEDSLMSLNKLLADKLFCESLKSKLLFSIPADKRNAPEVVVKRLVWRITSNMFYKMQESIFSMMKKNHSTVIEKFVMSETDRSSFKSHIGNLLRSVYRFGIDKKNSIWVLRCQCLRERFVDAPENLTSEQFLDHNSWQVNSISLSSSCFNLFVGIERIIKDLLGSSSPCTADTVFNSLSNPENIILLSEMRFLSQGMLSEDLAIGFLQELVKTFTALSGRLEAKRSLGIHSQKQKTSTVSLRTNLKRDPKTSQPSPAPPAKKACVSPQPSSSKKTKKSPTAPQTVSKKSRASSSRKSSSTPDPPTPTSSRKSRSPSAPATPSKSKASSSKKTSSASTPPTLDKSRDSSSKKQSSASTPPTSAKSKATPSKNQSCASVSPAEAKSKVSTRKGGKSPKESSAPKPSKPDDPKPSQPATQTRSSARTRKPTTKN